MAQPDAHRPVFAVPLRALWRTGAVIAAVVVLSLGLITQSSSAHATVADSPTAPPIPAETQPNEVEILDPETTPELQAATNELDLVISRKEITKYVNDLRSAKKLRHVVADPRLDAVAQAWSEKQAAAQKMSHNPHVVKQVPKGHRWVGENVAYGYKSSKAVVDAWRKSPGHYANITKDVFTHVGTGIAYSSRGVAYFTQVFVQYPDGLKKPGSFADVFPGDPFFPEIEWMHSSGLSTGTKSPMGAIYQPKNNVSREAMAAFLYRLNTPKGAQAPAGYKIPKVSPFSDVATNHKFFPAIAWMHSEGISTGIKQAGKKPAYNPKSPVTREAMAAFLQRLDGKPGYKAPKKSPFADVSTKHKFYPAIAWMRDQGISTGTRQATGLPKYNPSNPVTREAMAAFLHRLTH